MRFPGLAECLGVVVPPPGPRGLAGHVCGSAGEVEFVEIESRLGESCHLRNTWGTTCRVSGTDATVQELDGDVLYFSTEKGTSYRVLPASKPNSSPRRVPTKAGRNPISFSVTAASGKVLRGALGREKEASCEGLGNG